MYRAVFCLTHEHMPWAAPLAALVCWFSCLATLYLLRQARADASSGQFVWLAGSGLAAGIGIWSTHFIAMLGYDPGHSVTYDLPLTLLSLAVGAVSACLALALARRMTTMAGSLAAGALLGLGVAAMHFTGMAGVRLPGTFTWDVPTLGVALAIGCTLAGLALATARTARGRFADVLPATLLTGAIACLHFLAMAAAEVVPDPALAPEIETFPRDILAAGIAAGMLTILAMSALALFAEHLRRANRRLRESKSILRDKSELLDTVLGTMDQGLMMVDAAGRVRMCNDRAVALLGLPPELMRAQRPSNACALIRSTRAVSTERRMRWPTGPSTAPAPSSMEARKTASSKSGRCPCRVAARC